MTQPFDVFNLTDQVASSAGMLFDAFQPSLIAQTDLPPEQMEFLPRAWMTLRSYLDINLLKSLTCLFQTVSSR